MALLSNASIRVQGAYDESKEMAMAAAEVDPARRLACQKVWEFAVAAEHDLENLWKDVQSGLITHLYIAGVLNAVSRMERWWRSPRG